MNQSLKKDLDDLLSKYPQLKDKTVAFTDTSFSLSPSEGAAPCEQPPVLPDVIAGTSSKIEVRKSRVHGYGVFAKEAIEPGEFIEHCKLLRLSLRAKYQTDSVIKDYVWGGGNCNCAECRKHGVYQYLALGFGSIYNHSDTPNTKQVHDFNGQTLSVSARQRIEKDEEIFLTYGSKYFLIRDFWKNINKTNGLEKALLKNKQSQ